MSKSPHTIISRTLCIAFAISSMTSLAYSQNTCIIKRDGSTFPGDDAKSVYPDNHQCSVCPSPNIRTAICSVTDRLMLPARDLPQDFVSIPHRGYWGHYSTELPYNYAAENTLDAFVNASHLNFKIIEVDVALTNGTSPNTKAVYLGHYFDMNAFGGQKGADPRDSNINHLKSLQMRRRDGKFNSNGNRDRLVDIEQVISWAKANNILLMVDPKEGSYKYDSTYMQYNYFTDDSMPQPIPYSEQEYLYIISYVLKAAKTLDALQNIVIKTNKSVNTQIGYLRNAFFGTWESQYEGRFLWSPVTGTTPTASTKDDTLDFIYEWHKKTADSRGVITYEASMYNKDYWGMHPFRATTDDYDVYADHLPNFITQMNLKPKRVALWSIDTMSPRGTLGRQYNWKFIGNVAKYDPDVPGETPQNNNDTRGDPFFNMSIPDFKYMAINTDMPIFYQSAMNN